MARGEFSIVIASLGALIEPELSALAGTYVLITVLTGSIITRLVGGNQKAPATKDLPDGQLPLPETKPAART